MTYVYDANGNIVSKTPYTNVTSSDLSTATQGTAIVYGYGDGNWSDKLTSYDGQMISYDASGNPTSYRGETVTWNGRLMTSFTKDDRRYEYSYNSDGMRTVKKVYKNNELVYTYTYIWDGDVLLAGRMEVADADEPITIRYLYDDSGELYGMDYNGNGYYGFIKNLQGDIVLIVPLDSESNVELNMEYDAWGKVTENATSADTENITETNPIRYRGYYYDTETRLYYLKSRYYDPAVKRFLNVDGLVSTSVEDAAKNMYAYCLNNPVIYADPEGDSFIEINKTMFNTILRGINTVNSAVSNYKKQNSNNQSDDAMKFYSDKFVEPALEEFMKLYADKFFEISILPRSVMSSLAGSMWEPFISGFRNAGIASLAFACAEIGWDFYKYCNTDINKFYISATITLAGIAATAVIGAVIVPELGLVGAGAAAATIIGGIAVGYVEDWAKKHFLG